MDKNWVWESKWSHEFYDGVNTFMQFAISNVAAGVNEIPWPCNNCLCGVRQSTDTVHKHLFQYGFNRGCTIWNKHGERSDHYNKLPFRRSRFDCIATSSAGLNNMMGELYTRLHQGFEFSTDSNIEPVEDANIPDAESAKFLKYMEDAKKPLFEGATISKLDWIVRSFHLKCESHWTNKSFNRMLEIQKAINPNADIPANYAETKKMIGDIGFSYDKINACPNDCMLFFTEEDNKLDTCRTCEESRWSLCRNSSTVEASTSKSSKRVSAKVLRFFSIKKRLQRLFLSSKTAENMTWHASGRTNDGILRHPADGEEWKRFDNCYQDFAAVLRNVRLGLSADGLEPFKHGAPHSLWPVTLVVYNLPPWMSMKQPYTQMPLLILGPSSPTNNIDIYLRPLIEELKDLWINGIVVYDVFKKERFTLHAALLWTINDFPTYAMLSRWSTKGYLACPVCQGDTHSYKLEGTRITCYTGHRRWLDANHPYRRNRSRFDGQLECRPPPPNPSGRQEFEDVQHIKVVFGKTTTNIIPNERGNNWRKNSIFNELPYWRDLLLRHNLDVMHIDKNVCELLLGTLLNTKLKSKDILTVQHALAKSNLRPELHPISRGNGKWAIPPAKYTMLVDEKLKFLRVIKDIKVPDGYSSNISKCVNIKEKRMTGLKSHDCHVIMQQLLPIAIRVLPDNDVVAIVTELCHYFRELCSKEYTSNDFKLLEKKIIPILCRMEMLLPPSIFTVMLHLTIHLPREAQLSGPVVYRYMYPFERMMYKLKEYIRNKSRPEGSIAKGFLAVECMTFCSMYMEGVETTFNRPGRNEESTVEATHEVSVFRDHGKILRAGKFSLLTHADLSMIHRYILFNCPEVEVFVGLWNDQYQPLRGQSRPRDINNARIKFFPSWFREYAHRDQCVDSQAVTEEIRMLAYGPDQVVDILSGYVVNRYRFHTKFRDTTKKFQNSGVCLTSTLTGYASARDVNPPQGDIDYYGVLQEIVQVRYRNTYVVLFKCKWYDVLRRNYGSKIENGLLLLNSSRLQWTNKPYILASQARQCFYVPDPRDEGWQAAVTINPRDYYNMGDSDDTNVISCPTTPVIQPNDLYLDVDNIILNMRAIEPKIIDDLTSIVSMRGATQHDVEASSTDSATEEEE